MKAFMRLALLGQLGLASSFAVAGNSNVAAVQRDSITATVSWMHHAPGGQTGIRAGDIQFFKQSSGETESIGAATIAIVGVMPADCFQMANHSASGSAQLTLFIDANSARFEIRDTPTYVIDAKSIRTCGIRKK